MRRLGIGCAVLLALLLLGGCGALLTIGQGRLPSSFSLSATIPRPEIGDGEQCSQVVTLGIPEGFHRFDECRLVVDPVIPEGPVPEPMPFFEEP